MLYVATDHLILLTTCQLHHLTMADDPAAKRVKKAEYNSKRTIAGRAKRYTLEYGCDEETNHKLKQYLYPEPTPYYLDIHKRKYQMLKPLVGYFNTL